MLTSSPPLHGPRSSRSRLLAAILVALFAVPLSNCFLDRPASGPAAELTASLAPTMVCPTDPVTFEWAYSTAGPQCTLDDPADSCAVPLIIELEPAELLSDPSPHTTVGSQTTPAPSADAAFTVNAFRWFRVTGDMDDRTDERSVPLSLNVIGEGDGTDEVRRSNEGACIAADGGRSPGWMPGSWTRETLDIGESVRVLQVCNDGPFPEIVFHLRYDSPVLPADIIVPSTECRDVPHDPAFPDSFVQRIIVRPVDIDAALEGAECRPPRTSELIDFTPIPDVVPRPLLFRLRVGC